VWTYILSYVSGPFTGALAVVIALSKPLKDQLALHDRDLTFSVSSHDRIPLEMNFQFAANMIALRAAISQLIVRSTSDPESVMDPPEDDKELLEVVRAFSHVSAAGSDIPPQRALQK